MADNFVNNSLGDLMIKEDNIKFNDLLSVENINKLKPEKDKSDKDKSNETKILDEKKSLFARDAYIDYARYVNSERWLDYKNDNDKFTTNSTVLSINKPVENQIPSSYGLTLPSIIEWSEKYPALQLRYQDFTYCKLLGLYANNKLIVLRKFKNGAPDNLFDMHIDRNSLNDKLSLQPVATLVTWQKPEEEYPTFTFAEKWSANTDDIFNVLAEVESDFTATPTPTPTPPTTPTIANKINNTTQLDIFLIKSLFGITDSDKLSSSPLSDLKGNPNMIKKSAIRNTDGDGISGSININLTFEYEMRYIKGVDPGIAMIDLMSNCMRMGVSVAEFRLNFNFFKKNDTITNIINGDFETIFDNFSKRVSELNKSIVDGLKSFLTSIKENSVDKLGDFFANPGKVIGNAAIDLARYIISRYREKLKAALAAETGAASGTWHVTYGNPKIPVLSIGDLCISSSSITLGKELGYNDFPNSFAYKIDLAASRPRGRQELERIFNTGRGRFYVYEDPSLDVSYNLPKSTKK